MRTAQNRRVEAFNRKYRGIGLFKYRNQHRIKYLEKTPDPLKASGVYSIFFWSKTWKRL